MKLRQHSCLSPLVAVAFVVICTTGMVLFFHFKNGSLMMLCEWFAWILALLGGAHLLLNRGPFTSHFATLDACMAVIVGDILGVLRVPMGAGKCEFQAGIPNTLFSFFELNNDDNFDSNEVSNVRGSLLFLNQNADGQLVMAEAQQKSNKW